MSSFRVSGALAGWEKLLESACWLWPAKRASVRESSVGSEQGNAGGEPAVRQKQTTLPAFLADVIHVVSSELVIPASLALPSALASFKVTSPTHSALRITSSVAVPKGSPLHTHSITLQSQNRTVTKIYPIFHPIWLRVCISQFIARSHQQTRIQQSPTVMIIPELGEGLAARQT